MKKQESKFKGKLGRIADLEDFRDRVHLPKLGRLQTRVDLNPKAMVLPIMDQGRLGSCVGHGTTSCFEFRLEEETQKFTQLSRLGLYYDTRKLEGSELQDAGCQIRDAIKISKKVGIGLESLWPYDEKKFATQPSSDYYKNAETFQNLSYERVIQTHIDLVSALNNGHPIVGGISVYSSFPMESGYIVPMPTQDDSCEGGHCILFTGYDMKTKRYRFQNSWGRSWGDNGFGELSFEYLENPNLGSDFWVILQTETGQ
jgi:C1A family cysteine protease